MASSEKRRYLPSAKRKEEILDAALIEFSEGGFSGVTMQRIANRAGLSKAGLYAHFQSKDEIFEALVSRLLLPTHDIENWLARGNMDLPAFVDAYIERLYATLENPSFLKTFRLLLAEGERVPELVQRWQQGVVAAIQKSHQDFIEDCVARGMVRASVLTENFFSLALAPVTLWLVWKMMTPLSPPMSLEQLRDAHRWMLLSLLEP